MSSQNQQATYSAEDVPPEYIQSHGARCTITHTTDTLQVEVQGRPCDDIKDVVSAAHQEQKHFADKWTAVDYNEFVTMR
ncbi:hypothetical protein [Natronorubrum sp. FCH18a]|uniref:hypothetical protein n=1 Tax=Natronorubrum sp. FCH18a TaxID=3447018 RepID=UPI003F517F12